MRAEKCRDASSANEEDQIKPVEQKQSQEDDEEQGSFPG